MATPAAAQPGHDPLERESTPGLLSRLFGDFTSLLRNEIALAKAELADSTDRAKAGLAALIGAVATLLAGSLVLVAAIVLGLAEVVEPWLAALIVGVVIIAVRSGGVASRLDFQPGDIIVQVGNDKITDVIMLDEITRTPQRMWSVTIKRNGRLMKLQMSG